MAKTDRAKARNRRHGRVRKKVNGNVERPRMAVHRSNKHISVQIIDDVAGHTLAAASSLETGLCPGSTSNIEAAKSVGQQIAERAKGAGIEKVVFDRGGNRYHGRVAAVAEAAREAGLEL